MTSQSNHAVSQNKQSSSEDGTKNLSQLTFVKSQFFIEMEIKIKLQSKIKLNEKFNWNKTETEEKYATEIEMKWGRN